MCDVLLKMLKLIYLGKYWVSKEIACMGHLFWRTNKKYWACGNDVITHRVRVLHPKHGFEWCANIFTDRQRMIIVCLSSTTIDLTLRNSVANQQKLKLSATHVSFPLGLAKLSNVNNWICIHFRSRQLAIKMRLSCDVEVLVLPS